VCFISFPLYFVIVQMLRTSSITLYHFNWFKSKGYYQNNFKVL